MKNSNIIISVIVVLCIAGGVTAYQVLNPNDSVFSNLEGFTPSETVDTSVSEGEGESTGGGSSDGSASSNGGSSSNGNGGGSSGGSGIASSEAKQIATKYIGEPGAYAGTPKKSSNGNWIVPIYDKNGNLMGGAEIDSKGNYIGLG